MNGARSGCGAWSEWPRTNRVLEECRASGWHLGAQVHVSRDGRTLLSLPHGERRPGEPMTVDTLLLWRSAGKPLTVLAVARAFERGLLALDQPVAEHIPEFGAGGKDAVTIRHLLTHTAGFAAADGLQEDATWDQTTAAIAATPLDPGAMPGVTARYQTTSSWHVLGEILRRVHGSPFDQVLRREVLDPCGMAETWLGMPPEIHAALGPRIGTTFRTFPGPPTPHPTWDSAVDGARCRPGANARGPTSDLGKFYEVLLDGGRGVVRPETLQTFLRPSRVGSFDETFRHVVDYGVGFLLDSKRHGPTTVPYGYGRHASDVAFGHSGAQSACAFADPRHGLVVAWVCNGAPGEPRHQRRQRALNEAIYEDLGLGDAISGP